MEENIQETPHANPNDAESAFNTDVLSKFGAKVDESSSESNLSVEDAFFKPTETNTEQAPHEEQAPQVQETPSEQEQPLDAKNDERRYQYWQSQAARRDNELDALRKELDDVKSSNETSNNQATQPEPVQEFPPSPLAPKKPARFSREEAWNDSQSESARYLDEKDQWDNDIAEYNELKHQYDLAVMQDKLEKQDARYNEQEQQRQNKIEQTRQMRSISEHVQGHYGFTPTETNEFIKTMSNPESISMDNLVQLFRMNQAGANPQPSKGPSEGFRQAKNAQQIPSPMGVMPSQAPEPNKSDENSIMDDLINTHKSKNPWT